MAHLAAASCRNQQSSTSRARELGGGCSTPDAAAAAAAAARACVRVCPDPQTLPVNFRLEDHMLTYPPRPMPERSCACRVDVTKTVVMTSDCPTPWDHPAGITKVCVGVVRWLAAAAAGW